MKRGLTFFSLLGLAVMLAGCGGSDTTGLVGNKNPRIRAVNDFSDVSAVGATVDTKTLLTSQAFGMSSAYTIIDNGNRDITFTDMSGAGSIPLTTLNTLLEENHYYTAIGVGNGPDGRRIILLDDTTTLTPNMSKVRVVNADQNDALVDVYFTSTATADLTGQTPQITNLAYGDAATLYTDFTPGTYKVWVTPAGSTTPITSPNMTFTTNTAVTLVVVQTSGGFEIQTIEDRPLPAGTP
jgi:hypothetical protein